MLSEVGQLASVLVKYPSDAFVSAEIVATEWKSLAFTSPPVLAAAVEEFHTFLDTLRSTGAEIHLLPRDSRTTLDSIYARDASTVSARGMILCRMGKALRAGEPAAQRDAFTSLGIPIAGEIIEPGTLEGGDVVWFDDRTVAVGRGYRTNDEGIRQFRALLGDSIDELVVVPLPHWRGPGDVFHLMSLISPVSRDQALVYAPLLPVPFREWLVGRGYGLIEVPADEFESMGTNVLALGTGVCVMLRGNPRTRRAIEQTGLAVVEYAGDEISVKGGGGPTCLTRPLARGPVPAR
jgi:N-dimethylarginine dimethylaminohydrolase